MGRQPVVAICGSGNAGHALAVALSQNFEGVVSWLIGSEEKADLLRRRTSAPGLQSTGVIKGRADRLRTISSDPAEVIPDADIVMIVVPAFWARRRSREDQAVHRRNDDDRVLADPRRLRV
jgi:glycerol-3-phosphate dehydrogenase